MLLSELNNELSVYLKESGLESSDQESKIIICQTLGITTTYFSLNKNLEIVEENVEKIFSIAKRRAAKEPLAYIFEEQEFYGLKFKIKNGVLVPRPETERLVEHAIEWVKKNNVVKPKIADLGSGSGCIGISILNHTDGKLESFDKSEVAVSITKENINFHKLSLKANAYLKDIEDIGQEFDGQFDVVVANPPYISEFDTEVEESVKIFEPTLALFSGTTGLECIESWSKKAASMLKAGGLCLFEIGYKQGSAAQNIFSQNSLFESVEILRDYEGRDRIVKAIRKGHGQTHNSGRV